MTEERATRLPTGTESDDDTLVDLLVQASFEIVAVLTRVGAEQDLSLTQVRMLGILRDRTPTMAQLADFLGLERSTVSGLVDRAEARGLVSRRSHASDRRSTELVITAAGRQLSLDARAEVGARIAPIVERMPLELRNQSGRD